MKRRSALLAAVSGTLPIPDGRRRATPRASHEAQRQRHRHQLRDRGRRPGGDIQPLAGVQPLHVGRAGGAPSGAATACCASTRAATAQTERARAAPTPSSSWRRTCRRCSTGLGIARDPLRRAVDGRHDRAGLALKHPAMVAEPRRCATPPAAIPAAAAAASGRSASRPWRRKGMEPLVDPTLERWFTAPFRAQRTDLMERVGGDDPQHARRRATPGAATPSPRSTRREAAARSTAPPS